MSVEYLAVTAGFHAPVSHRRLEFAANSHSGKDTSIAFEVALNQPLRPSTSSLRAMRVELGVRVAAD
jgi:hypothetical protein